MGKYDAFYKAREIITDILECDFVGPVSDDEVLSESPLQYYIMGKLYPQEDVSDDLDMARNPFEENQTETYDAVLSKSNQRNPSSMGITCTVKKGVEKILISGSYAFYEPVLFEEASNYDINTEPWNDLEKKPEELWVRKSFTYHEEVDINKERVQSVDLDNRMSLKVYYHAEGESGSIITVALINENETDGNYGTTSRLCAFQPYITISGFGKEAVFEDTRQNTRVAQNVEILELEMLYSDIKCFAQGHGCSVEWEDGEGGQRIYSRWMPTYNLHQMMATDMPDTKVLSMKFLAHEDQKVVIEALLSFADQYKEWIDNLRKKTTSMQGTYIELAEGNIKKCEMVYNRINRTIKALDEPSNAVAYMAFRYANEAMLLQRIQTYKKSDRKFDEDEITWYPFQLAFILQELYSFIYPECDEREIVDLLWFPTGGGKTEAYLGIAAFTIFLRRLRNNDDDGVTVIMRYTLRLLTLQQFERASMLIIACEIVRKKYQIKGGEITIGLWVGGKLTPNSLDDARRSLNKQIEGAVISQNESNPYQIKICPWCGRPIPVSKYKVQTIEHRMYIRCDNENCETSSFSDGLPVHIIDDAIYSHLPTFLVATVDKFAQIPLSDKPAAIFGIKNKKKPPELIIQDELHLISGPLGTMTGIYEAAISKLCEKDGVKAKIIASTATIRNAESQIKSLYGRSYSQFPPQGVTAKDSFFAVEAGTEERPARLYCGVMGIGTTTTTTVIRVNAALLFATRYLTKQGFDEKVVDNFWTLTGYFNSLRELGGASTQMLDDVQSRFNYLENTKFKSKYPMRHEAGERFDNLIELTSRMDNSDITTIIQDRLKRSYRDGQHKDVYDFVLASNMISVGVDVGRLGTMTVVGQPKTNAEYIQATSRVGRDNPGLVVTVYNSTRSRDRSHYEQFMKYHSALYRYVEATSLTPFADRARDRGLHALYVSLCRYLVPGLLDNRNAACFNPEGDGEKKVEKMIIDYVDIVDPEESENVFKELRNIEKSWEYEATGELVYKSYRNEKDLLKEDLEDDRFRTMNSMRNVDAQAGIYLLGR